VAKRRNPKISVKEGDYVLYKRRNVTEKKSRKLHTVWVRPYRILAVNEDTGNCLLEIPDALKIHPWFATDKLKAFNSRDGTLQHPPIARKQKRRNTKLRKFWSTTKKGTHILLSGKDTHRRTTAGSRL
jgi:hypothetical protein